MSGPLHDRIARLRHAEAQDILDRASPDLPPPDPAYLGRVYSGGSLPTVVPRYYLTRPIEVSGDEVEGGTPTVAVDAASSVPVLVLGPRVPVAGDDLIARLIGGRWVAGMPVAMGGYPGIDIAGCLCQDLPQVIAMTTSGAGCTNAFNGTGRFYPCTFRYVPVPAALLSLGIGHVVDGVRYAYLSDEQFTDSSDASTNPFRFHLWCYTGAFAVCRVYEVSLFASPFQSVDRYSWAIGAVGNTCAPFAMTAGSVINGPGSCDVDLFDATP